MSTDFYSTIGVSRTASEDEIKKAYRKQAMKYHPDRNPDNKEAEDKFKTAAEAYEVLGDPEKRRIYDRYGIEGLRNTGYSGPGNFEDIFSNFGDIFEDLFGFGTGRSGARRDYHGPVPGADLRYDLTISFMEAVHGISKEIEISKKETCWTCEGSGLRPGHQPEICPACQGRGQVMRAQGFFRLSTTCPQCHGQGRIIKDPCNDCGGTGLVSKKKKVSFKIPAGVDHGSRMRLRGEGEGGRRGGESGDLYIIIYVEPHEFFHRDGNNILCELPISMTQAALGYELKVPSIHGKTDLSIPLGTQHGQTFVLKSEGVTSLRGDVRGDMIIRVSVKIPDNLSKRQEELLREFSEIEEKKEGHQKGGFFKKLFDHLS
ncbi:MAG: molecular chaperone DnaJ [Desulfobulbaceae bacterium]|nr:molecular chaperone DnaJ [Desulfobulbaceae bacterium]MCK5436849.1 molecular chaperone DnaJ [Desulfobulbaceae bacterium]MCK5544140.1 molecular chaperone DnaJ [Desulfobulbaceae bacterium]